MLTNGEMPVIRTTHSIFLADIGQRSLLDGDTSFTPSDRFSACARTNRGIRIPATSIVSASRSAIGRKCIDGHANFSASFL
jgi:hypothetical protein